MAGSKNLQENVSFTLKENAKVTVSITGNGQDPILSWIAMIQDEKTGEFGSTDTQDLKELIGAAEGKEKGNYTDTSWNKFQAALEKAKEVQKYVLSTAEEIAAATAELKDAMGALQTPKEYLQSSIEMIAISESNAVNYEKDAMWEYYQQVLASTKDLLAKEDLTEAEAEAALKELRDTIELLTPKKTTPQPPKPPVTEKKNQVITVKASFTKAYGDKAFSLGAKVKTGNGKLSYKSSNGRRL